MTKAAIIITPVEQGASAKGGLERVAGVLTETIQPRHIRMIDVLRNAGGAGGG